MTDKPLSDAEALLRAEGVPPASVTPLVSVVRSGEQFLILPSPSEEQAAAGDAGPLARILVEWGYDVPKPRHGDFQTFLKDRHAVLVTPSVEGVDYLGTYTVFQQSERSLGSFRTIWGFTSLARMEAMSAQLAANPADPWCAAVLALMDYRDSDYGAGRFQSILQRASATLIG